MLAPGAVSRLKAAFSRQWQKSVCRRLLDQPKGARYMAEVRQNKISYLGDGASICMFLLITSSMRIRKLVVNEPRRTLAICSLKACNVCHLLSGFYGKIVSQQRIEL